MNRKVVIVLLALLVFLVGAKNIWVSVLLSAFLSPNVAKVW